MAFNKSTLLSLFLITLFITFYSKFIFTSAPILPPTNLTETFDPALSRINSIETFELEIANRLNNDYADTSKLVNCIDNIIRERFYHTYSEYTPKQNWISYVLGKTIMWGFLCPIEEEDILQFPFASCSQQSILFQKMLSIYGIKYCSVKFNTNDTSIGGHFALQAYYQNSWHYFDPNKESVKKQGDPSIETQIQNGEIYAIYDSIVSKEWLNKKVEANLIKSEKNEIEGNNMRLFHKITRFLSSWLWLVFLIGYFSLKFQKPTL
jgi:hypothetical protein